MTASVLLTKYDAYANMYAWLQKQHKQPIIANHFSRSFTSIMSWIKRGEKRKKTSKFVLNDKTDTFETLLRTY